MRFDESIRTLVQQLVLRAIPITSTDSLAKPDAAVGLIFGQPFEV